MFFDANPFWQKFKPESVNCCDNFIRCTGTAEHLKW